jgi:hypothetical protein
MENFSDFAELLEKVPERYHQEIGSMIKNFSLSEEDLVDSVNSAAYNLNKEEAEGMVDSSKLKIE